jgi:pimeloyl-ACP methyl ester carboxylesterase
MIKNIYKVNQCYSMKLILLFILAIFLVGCSTVKYPINIEKINNQVSLEYVLLKNDSDSTIIFENGMGITYEYWYKIIQNIDKESSIFIYNRPGYGKSKYVNTARDSKNIVEELREHLYALGLKPPYVLVGHSMGGLYMQYFARKYPNEVKGLILVDSTHPLQLKGNGSYENWPLWYRSFFNFFASDMVKSELNYMLLSGEEVLNLPVPNIPIIILNAKQDNSYFYKELAEDANAKRKDLMRLYPKAKYEIIDSGHMIPVEKPEAVINSIKSIIE